MTQVLPILLWQLLAAAIVAALFWSVSPQAAASALVGGFCCVLPNAYMAGRLWLKSGLDPRRFVRAAHVAEVLKLGLTALCFTAVFVWLKWIHAPALFAGFIAAIFTQWLGLLWLGRDPRS